MANNRIYLKCICGESLYLGKRIYGGYYYDSNSGESLEDKLNKFYDEHEYCGDGYDHFEIVYEDGRNPERERKNHWVQISPAKIYECSECGQNVMTDDIECYKYCHGCGARMVEDDRQS